MIETCNAVIKFMKITNEDHGMLSAWLTLDYGGAEQGFGGYCLYTPSKFRQQKNYAGLFIWRVLETVGVSEWEQLPGKIIRVRKEHTKVHAIGHIVKDIWFAPSVELAVLERGKVA